MGGITPKGGGAEAAGRGFGPAAEYLTQAECGRLLRISGRTLERMRLTGTGPKFLRLGSGSGCRGRILYDRRAIEEWAASRSFASTSEAAEAQRCTS